MLKSIDHLMGYLLYELKIRKMPITKFKMLDLIYKIKMEFDELSPILPYYWCYLGPYSNMVDDSYKQLKKFCVGYNSIILNENSIDKFKINQFISEYSEIEDIASNILNDQDFFYSSLEKDIFRQYAPLNIMYPFKFDIYDVAYNLRSINSFNCDDYVKSVCMCEAKLPNDRYFDQYNDLFSDFITNLDFINEEHNLSYYWSTLRFPIIELYKTFARGVRVQFHDEIYNDFEDIWDLKFKNSLSELRVIVNKTEQYVNFSFEDNEYTNSEKKIINSTIGSYLKG